MKYGYFDNKKKEYVITTYNTPLPWINYLTNGEMFSLISNYGGGYSYYKDSKLRRITRFTYNTPNRDNNGRMFYIDDGKEIFSPTFYPSKTELDSYECHVGLNYTRFISSKNDLGMELTCFIPLKDNVEINKLVLTNNSDSPKEILLYSGVEFCLWNALDDMTNFQRNFSTGEVEVCPSVIYHKTEYKERRNHYSFYCVNHKVDSFQTDRDSFIGLHGDYQLPQEIKNKKLSNKIASGWSPIGFFQIRVILKPHESKSFMYLLGYVENADDDKFESPGIINKKNAVKLIEKYSKDEQVEQAFNDLAKHWDNLLNTYHIDSEDEKLNTEVNIWHQYQCMMTYYLSRSASYYESGIGRGMGFRDSCQDLLGFVHLLPKLAKERIIDIASIMMNDGSTWHQYQPLDKKGNADIGGGFNDDPLWLIAATYAYISETGDKNLLNEIVPYNNSDTDKGTILEHLSKAFNYIVSHKGPHGLPLIGHADWNDCLNLNCFSSNPGESFQCFQGKDTGVAESVFIGAMLVKYGKEYAELLELVNKDNSHVLSEVEQMKVAIYKYGYDTDHFLRAYDAYGHKVGSYENEEGQIYIEPQGMCVMAGLGLDNDMASKALKTTHDKLNTKYGICLLSPCYTTYHIELGEISSYPVGYKENGGIFCHNNPWVIIAECLNNNGQQAFEYYKEITPAYIEDISNIHRTEPYVYSQMIAGIEAPNFGEAKNSWLTGTAAWTFVAISMYLLGVRPTLNGLLIEPKLNMDVTIKRIYKGKTIHIKTNGVTNKSILISNEQLAKSEGDIYVEL